MNARTYQNIVSDMNWCRIKNQTVGVKVNIVAKMNIFAIIAMKRGFNINPSGSIGQQIPNYGTRISVGYIFRNIKSMEQFFCFLFGIFK